jgi:hypothetical protein
MGMEDGTRMFGFGYFPNVDEDATGFAVEWSFYLSEDQVRAIASGELVALGMWRCDPDCGDRTCAREWYCSKCDPPPSRWKW